MCNHPNINTIHGVYYTIENGKYNKKIISELGNGDLFEFVQTNNISEKFAKYNQTNGFCNRTHT